jgi:hypothetical protein
MKLSIFLSSGLFATNILATLRGLAQKVEQGSHIGNSRPLNLLQRSLLRGQVNVLYDLVNTGAVITQPLTNQTFNAVSGQFNVPKPSTPPVNNTHVIFILVGIDGYTYTTAALIAGVIIETTNNNSIINTSSYAIYNWLPNNPTTFSDFSVTTDDEIRVSITTSSHSAGKVVLENLTTRKSVSKSLTAPSSSILLGGQNAEWLVSSINLDVKPFLGNITFSSCTAKTAKQTLTANNATVVELFLSGVSKTFTSASINGSTVTVTY